MECFFLTAEDHGSKPWPVDIGARISCVQGVLHAVFFGDLKAIDLEPEFHLDHFPQGIIIHCQVTEVADKSYRYEFQVRLLDRLPISPDRELEKKTRGSLARQHRCLRRHSN